MSEGRGYGMYYDSSEKNIGVFITIPSKDFGIEGPLEIDILCRLSHPCLLWCMKIFTPRDATVDDVTLLVPVSDYSLETLIDSRKLTTAKKIPVVWRMLNALGFLHDKKISHNHITENSFFFSKGDILLGDFSKCSTIENTDNCEADICERGKNNGYEKILIDIKNLGKIIYRFFTERTYDNEVNYNDFSIIDGKYRDNIFSFLEKMLNNKIDEESEDGSPKYFIHELMHIFCDTISENCEDIEELETNRYDYEADYNCFLDSAYEGEKHRDLIKIIVNCCEEYYRESNVKLMFLAVDLLKRTDSFLTEKTFELRIINAYTCLYLALKLLGLKVEKIKYFIDNIVAEDFRADFTEEKVKTQEFEITRLTKGCYLDLHLYNLCKNYNSLSETFYNVIMDKDCTLYKNIDENDWFEKLNNVFEDSEMIHTNIATFLGTDDQEEQDSEEQD